MLSLSLTACPKKPDPKPDPAVTADGGGASPNGSSDTTALSGDPVHGKELVAKFECNRCHDGTGFESAPQAKNCVHCHTDIVEGRFEASAAAIAKWKPKVKDIAIAPSLTSTAKRFNRRWVEDYLLAPSDLRPHLAQYMPRLEMTAAEAKDIAAYLTPEEASAGAGAGAKAASDAIKNADLGKGRALLESKGCGTCHAFSGVAAFATSAPPAMDAKDLEHASALAPDLRVTRDRMTAARVVAWLKDPKSVKADTLMPKIALSDDEARDLAGYLMTAELGAMPPKKPHVDRLPVLTRKVTYKEIDEKVFHHTCWHCHSEPDYAIGDGGPGNSGGLGFRPRGLNLSDYNGIAAGYLDEKNERASVFAKDDKGVPRIIAAMMARHEEESGNVGPLRGMPLGYEALPLEDIQLVDTWIAQGRPR